MFSPGSRDAPCGETYYKCVNLYLLGASDFLMFIDQYCFQPTLDRSRACRYKNHSGADACPAYPSATFFYAKT
jgi:hypothetical protein